MRQQLRRWSAAGHEVCQCTACSHACSGPALRMTGICAACELAKAVGYPCHVPIPAEVIAQRAALSV